MTMKRLRRLAENCVSPYSDDPLYRLYHILNPDIEYCSLSRGERNKFCKYQGSFFYMGSRKTRNLHTTCEYRKMKPPEEIR